ncbi:aminotransferase class I/II-fold pyridoxal phosphate-dependent enzyme [Sphingomonas profundi]|uniref:aminotransferase class I/II-fold pyridoxal phosphate-dependent enzyme n=1 Tax=Alterirhizorhabdus profundi TaxID=2681549 RepID=UPI0012E7C57E|nr:aminotransferase class I/II-fold pyridoxal phosphate-dependent enzyme [Sphingomonas profundi]
MIDRWTWHGGGLRAARAHYGDGALPWIDLSTGINPRGWPVPVRDFDWASLPDELDLRGLEAAAAAHFRADPACVCAVPGTEIGLRLMDGLIDGPAYHLVPSYRSHGEMLGGSEPLAVARVEEADGATLILANPNNPDGRLLDPVVLQDMLLGRGRRGWLLVDEAFADTTPALSIAGIIGEDRRLIAFRSFGKFFGLAGLRLGFVLGPPSFLAHVRRKLGAWPLPAATIAIGTAAYRDRDWIEAASNRLLGDARRLDVMLRRSGYRPIGGCPLFRLVETDDAHGLFERLAGHAILTRPFADRPRWLRIGLPPDEAAFSRLRRALARG